MTVPLGPHDPPTTIDPVRRAGLRPFSVVPTVRYRQDARRVRTHNVRSVIRSTPVRPRRIAARLQCNRITESAGGASSRSSSLHVTLAAWLGDSHRHPPPFVFALTASDSANKGSGPSRSGFPTSGPRSSPRRRTNSHSLSRRAHTKPTIKRSSTRWPATSETGRDLDRVGGQRLHRQAPTRRHRAR